MRRPPRPITTASSVVQPICEGHVRVGVDVIERTGQGLGPFREGHRRGGQFLAAAGGVVAGTSELPEVFAVVLADRVEVPTARGMGARERGSPVQNG